MLGAFPSLMNRDMHSQFCLAPLAEDKNIGTHCNFQHRINPQKVNRKTSSLGKLLNLIILNKYKSFNELISCVNEKL